MKVHNTHHLYRLVLVVLQHGHYEQVLVTIKNASRKLVSSVQLQHLYHVAGTIVQHHVLVLTAGKEDFNGLA